MSLHINEKATKLIEMLEGEKTDLLLNEHSYGRYAYNVAKKFLEQDTEIVRLRDLLERYHVRVDLFGESLEDYKISIPFEIDFGTLLALQEVHQEVRQVLEGATTDG